MKKKTSYAFGKKIYLLGKDENGTLYWLEEPSWDCGWYWGFGYIETYTNNKNPHLARDINSHQHWQGLIMNSKCNAYDNFKKLFIETPLSDNEIWELCDYMRTFYSLREVAELFNHGYSHYTEKAKIDDLKNQEQEDLINKKWLPEVFERIKNILKEDE